MIFREAVPQFEGFPFPTLPVIRDMAEFAGYNYGTLRTAISRARASGELESFRDKNGVTRFRLTKLQKSVSNVVVNWQTRPQGFTIVVFRRNHRFRKVYFPKDTHWEHYRIILTALSKYAAGKSHHII